MKIFESKTSNYYNTIHLYNVHTKINIPSINNVDKCPRQETSCQFNESLNQEICRYVRSTTWADSKYNGQIFLMKNWQMFSHLLPVHFCNYAVLCPMKIFYSDWVVFTKNIIN